MLKEPNHDEKADQEIVVESDGKDKFVIDVLENVINDSVKYVMYGARHYIPVIVLFVLIFEYYESKQLAKLVDII